MQTCHLLIYETLQCIHKNEKSKVNNGFKSVTLVCKKQISKIQLSETAPMSTDKIIHGLSIYQKIKLSMKLKRNLWIQFLNDNMIFFIYKIDIQNNTFKNPQNFIIKRLRYKKRKNHVIDESEMGIICTWSLNHIYRSLIFYLDFLIKIICGWC